jgi:hypothetical protein
MRRMLLSALVLGASSVEAQEIGDKYVMINISLDCPKGDSGRLKHTYQNQDGFYEQRIVTFMNGKPKFLSLANKEDNREFGEPYLIDLERLIELDRDEHLYLLELVDEATKLHQDICLGPPEVQKRYLETVARNRDILAAGR